jgi:starch phosphorylase
MHGNPKLANWITNKIGDDWATDLSKIKQLESYVNDSKAQKEFMHIKYENKVRVAEYIKKHNGIDIDPRSIFDIQVKRLHEYKRQLMNILHVMHLYNELRENPDIDMIPRTFIFGAKAAPGYDRAKLIIKLINNVANVINNDININNKIKVVFIENYNVSNAELLFAAADVSEQISTASKEASGTGNMKFMLNGAVTIGTMDGANIEIVEEAGEDNNFIFGLTSDEVIELQHNRTYDPWDIYNSNQNVRRVVTQLINGFYSHDNPDLFRVIYDSLLNGGGEPADQYFILKDFDAYAETQKKGDVAYRNQSKWARMAMTNSANAGKFSSDRTIEEYATEIWHLKKTHVELKS